MAGRGLRRPAPTPSSPRRVHPVALGTLAARDRRTATSSSALEPERARPPAEACPLTERELEILGLAAGGATNGRIARELWVTEQTVKFHLSNIYRKLGVANRTEASRYAYMHGARRCRRARSPPERPPCRHRRHRRRRAPPRCPSRQRSARRPRGGRRAAAARSRPHARWSPTCSRSRWPWSSPTRRRADRRARGDRRPRWTSRRRCSGRRRDARLGRHLRRLPASTSARRATIAPAAVRRGRRTLFHALLAASPAAARRRRRSAGSTDMRIYTPLEAVALPRRRRSCSSPVAALGHAHLARSRSSSARAAR